MATVEAPQLAHQVCKFCFIQADHYREALLEDQGTHDANEIGGCDLGQSLAGVAHLVLVDLIVVPGHQTEAGAETSTS